MSQFPVMTNYRDINPSSTRSSNLPVLTTQAGRVVSIGDDAGDVRATAFVRRGVGAIIVVASWTRIPRDVKLQVTLITPVTVYTFHYAFAWFQRHVMDLHVRMR